MKRGPRVVFSETNPVALLLSVLKRLCARTYTASRSPTKQLERIPTRHGILAVAE